MGWSIFMHERFRYYANALFLAEFRFMEPILPLKEKLFFRFQGGLSFWEKCNELQAK